MHTKQRQHWLVLAALLTGSATCWAAPFKKPGAELEVQSADGGLLFSINSTVGQHVCAIGIDSPAFAAAVDDRRAAWTSGDAADPCVVLLTVGDRKMSVTTKDCDAYCGMQAIGSMDGLYRQSR